MGGAPGRTLSLTSLVSSSQLFPGRKAAPPGTEDADQVSGWGSIPAGPEVPGGSSQASTGQGRYGNREAGQGAEHAPGARGWSVSWGWRGQGGEDGGWGMGARGAWGTGLRSRVTGREGPRMWEPCVVKAEEGQGPVSARMGRKHQDLAKGGTAPLRTRGEAFLSWLSG